MIRSLGPLGVLGILFTLAGIGVMAWVDPILATGFVLALVGIGLAVQSVVKNLLASFGFV